jgi:hypothetical protein
LNAKQLKYVLDTVDNEGFDYAFRHYSDFKDEVSDAKFHELREAYVKAAEELAEYVGAES